MKKNLGRWIYIALVAALVGSYYAGGATGFRLLSIGSTISAVTTGSAAVRHK